MTYENLQQLYNLTVGSAGSKVEQASQVAKSLMSEYESATPVRDFLADLIASNLSKVTHYADLEGAEMQYIIDMAENNKQTVFNSNDVAVALKVKRSLSPSSPHERYQVYCDGANGEEDVVFCTYEWNEGYGGYYCTPNGAINLAKLDFSTGGQNFYDVDVRQVFATSQTGSAITLALAEILEYAVAQLTTNREKFSEVMCDKIRSYKQLSSDLVDDLVLATTGGFTSLFNTVCTFIQNVKTFLSERSDAGEAYFSSTSIQINQFSSGCILQTIGTIVTTVGIALAAVSRIAAAVVAITGSIIQVAGRIVAAATTDYIDTLFKTNGDEYPKVFDFVIEQDTVTNVTLHNWMVENGISYGRLKNVNKFPYEIYFFDASDGTQANKYKVGYELHLSAEYDLRLAFDRTDTQGGNQVVYLKTGDIVTPDGLFVLDEWSDHPRSNWYEELLQYSYSPMSTSKFANVATTLTSEAATMLKSRFMSAIALINLWYVYQTYNVYRDQDDLPAWTYWQYSISDYSGQMSERSKFFLDSFANVNDILSAYFFNNSTAKQIPCWEGNVDRYLSWIEHTYDGLNYVRSMRNTSAATAEEFRHFMTTYKIDAFSNYVPTIFTGDYPSLSHVNNGLTEYTEPIIWSQQLPLMDFVEVWPTAFGVSIPSATWTGFIAGLIVDGVIVAASVALAIAGAKLAVKIKNRRAQLQAQAEADWYNYQDAYSSVGQDDGTGHIVTQEEVDASWGAYKHSRLKYNLTALATGQSTLQLGMLDDSGSDGGILNGLKDKLTMSATNTASGEVTTVTIANLCKLIYNKFGIDSFVTDQE